MISGIGNGDVLARTAIDAAFKRHAEKLAALKSQMSPGVEAQAEASGANFGQVLAQGIASVDKQVKSVDGMHVDLLQGKLDIHEVAARIQESKIAFDFAMQVRDRFIDAYREVMRMTV